MVEEEDVEEESMDAVSNVPVNLPGSTSSRIACF